ncbi:MAG: Hpt domain-containing protein [Verrucomicrobia bacterium]|nr:MAG: Hpt domain-containing protein [Verrucomicrobiota bacterium]
MGSINSGQPPQDPLLDYHQLETFAVIGIADYLKLLAEVIEDIPHQMAQISASIQEGNVPQTRARAHGLRGLVAYFGCVAMTSQLARLEELGDFSPVQAAAIHADLQVVWEQTLAAINAWQQSLPSASP